MTYGPMVSVAMVGIFGTPSNDPRSAGFRGFASCSLSAVMRAFVLMDMIERYCRLSEIPLSDVVVNFALMVRHLGRPHSEYPRMMSRYVSPLVPRHLSAPAQADIAASDAFR
jgi:hypothetical protein